MGTTSDKLNRLNQTKQGVKAFLISEGQTVTENDTFYSYISKLQATHKRLGSKFITQNGPYLASSDDLHGYDSVNVNVQPNLGVKTVTQNGRYSAVNDNLQGYDIVDVDVPSDFSLYHIEQVINDNKCTLNFTDYNGQTDDNYWVGSVIEGNKQKLFIIGDNILWENIQIYKYKDL